MSNSLRKLERQAVRKKTSSEGFQGAWQEYREKKWGEGNVPRDTNRCKLHFSDNANALASEMNQLTMIRNAIAVRVAEKLAKNKEKEQEEDGVRD